MEIWKIRAEVRALKGARDNGTNSLRASLERIDRWSKSHPLTEQVGPNDYGDMPTASDLEHLLAAVKRAHEAAIAREAYSDAYERLKELDVPHGQLYDKLLAEHNERTRGTSKEG